MQSLEQRNHDFICAEEERKHIQQRMHPWTRNVPTSELQRRMDEEWRWRVREARNHTAMLTKGRTVK